MSSGKLYVHLGAEGGHGSLDEWLWVFAGHGEAVADFVKAVDGNLGSHLETRYNHTTLLRGSDRKSRHDQTTSGKEIQQHYLTNQKENIFGRYFTAFAFLV